MHSPSPLVRLLWRIVVRLGLVLVLLVGLCLALGVQVRPAHAATDTVTDCSGENGPGQIGTVLSSASAGDTITFSCSGTIPITSTLTISTNNLTLDGSGQSVTLDGGNSTQVLSVNSGVTFTLNALTIAHGSAPYPGGGGLRNNGGTLTISNSTFANNSLPNGSGGGLENLSGTMAISNSTFSGNSAGNGGGLINQGTMTISTSTFANNSVSSQGGGIYNSGPLTISTSTFANNSASVFGGGLFNILGNTVSISNSTFADNSASFNGGGLYIGSGTVTIGGSIVAENTGSDCSNISGTITDNGYNLESGTSCNFTGTGSLQNTNPQLLSLANNGGPTQTIALQQGSPAIDVIPTSSNLCSVTDQRGNSRPDDNESSCDMGAYESNYVSLSLNGTNVNATEGSTFTGAVASGTYSGSGTLSASIDWGDGTSPSTGTVNQSGSSFTVSGSHTYAEEGAFTINVSVSDGQGQSTSTTSPAKVSDAALTLTHFVAGRLEHRWAGVAATFTDADPAGTVSDYTSTITWGDGTTSTVKVYKNPFGKGFVLAGTHRYATKGKYTVTLTVTDQGGSTLSKTTTITVK
jgi:hypothetical protein